MLFTWDWKNTCVIYKWWHVKTFGGFVGTLIAIALLGMFYEFLRNWIARWTGRNVANGTVHSRGTRGKALALYAVQVGYLFMLMLVFMTYNGWYMIATVIGAGIGHYFWGQEAEVRLMSCH